MRLLLFRPRIFVGFVLAWGVVWFVQSVIQGKSFDPFLVVASFVGLVLLELFGANE